MTRKLSLLERQWISKHVGAGRKPSLSELVKRASTAGAKIGLIAAWDLMGRPIPVRPDAGGGLS